MKNSKNEDDLLIGSYYVCPDNKKDKENLFEMLNKDTERFKKFGSTILVGDFNARTGEKLDFIPPDSFLEDLFDCPLSQGISLPPRNSEDQGTNKRGEELLDFCKTNEFAIVNGRKLGDLFGKYTSHQYNGSSTVDCLITTKRGFEKILYFEVGEYIPWLSDHSPVFADVKLDIDTKDQDETIPLHVRDQGYVWDEDCEEKFKQFLKNDKETLEKINQSTTQNSNANELAEVIKKSILEASKKCNLKKKKQIKILKPKPWFDKECSEIKHKITKMGKKLRGDRENKEVRNELFQLKSKLKKTVRKKKRLHKKTILQEMELCTSTSQKKYWK